MAIEHSEDFTADKRMKLRYAGVCRLCGAELPVRVDAIYERTTKTVRCVECPGNDLASVQPAEVVADGTTVLHPPEPAPRRAGATV